MNKLFKISVVVVLALALVCTVFAFAGVPSGMASGTVCPNVGWNSRIAGCGFGVFTLQSLDGLALLRPVGPIYTPLVGWNS